MDNLFSIQFSLVFGLEGAPVEIWPPIPPDKPPPVAVKKHDHIWCGHRRIWDLVVQENVVRNRQFAIIKADGLNRKGEYDV